MMDNKTAALILNDDKLVTVKAHYCGKDREYRFICPVHIAAGLRVGDLVLTENAYDANFNLAVVQITRIDDQLDIDPEESYQWKFVLQRVHSEYVDQLKDTLDRDMETLRAYGRAKRREQLKAAIQGDLLTGPADSVG